MNLQSALRICLFWLLVVAAALDSAAGWSFQTRVGNPTATATRKSGKAPPHIITKDTADAATTTTGLLLFSSSLKAFAHDSSHRHRNRRRAAQHRIPFQRSSLFQSSTTRFLTSQTSTAGAGEESGNSSNSNNNPNLIQRIGNMYAKALNTLNDGAGSGGKDEASKESNGSLASIVQLLLPLSAAFGVGYQVATWIMQGRLNRYIAEAASSSSSSSAAEFGSNAASSILSNRSPASRFPSISSILLTILVSQQIWNAIPMWIRRQIPLIGKRYRRMSQSKSSMDGDAVAMVAEESSGDLAALPVLIEKLNAILVMFSDKVDTLSLRGAKLSFFALIRNNEMLAKSKKRLELRQRRYAECGKVLSPTEAVEAMQGLDETFEFADWAYNEIADEKSLQDALNGVNYTLVRHDPVALPGSVAHYVAINKDAKKCVIGIKGTSNFEDFLTDMCGTSVAFPLDAPFSEGYKEKEIYCHEGIFLSARRLAEDLEVILAELLIPAGYKILITGHSLGAGVAAICGLLLRSKIPALQKDVEHLKVVAFASPPVLDLKASQACAAFTTTVVNNVDVIPRTSLNNLLNTLSLVKAVDERLEELGMHPKDLKSTAEYMNMMFNEKNCTAIFDAEEMDGVLGEVVQDDGSVDNLVCPGKVMHIYDVWDEDEEEDSNNKAEDADGEKKGDGKAGENENKEKPMKMQVYVGDGTSKVLRVLEFDPKMVDNHLAQPYREAIKSVLHPKSKSAAANAGDATTSD